MRILVLVHEYPPVGGGGGRVAQDLSKGFAEKGHEVRVLTALYQGLPEHELTNGFEVYRLRSGRTQAYRAGFWTMAQYVLAAFWTGLRMAFTWKPDVIHVHFAVPAGQAALMISRLSGVPYVLTTHLGDVPGGTPEKTRTWFRWIFPLTPPIWKSASAIVAVSDFTRQLALKHYPVDIQVVPNGVDLNLLKPGKMQSGTPPMIVFAGRFMQQKNPLQIVRVLNQLQDLPWHCTMIGDGPLRPEIEAEIDRFGLRDRFTLPGWIKPEEVIEAFIRADILYMPSFTEGLPVAGVQSLAVGLAIVAGRAGGFIDLVKDGENGYLVDPVNTEEQCTALRALLSNAERLAAFRAASRAAARKFDINSVVEFYLYLFYCSRNNSA
jgi:L-malate glycosyltransferase